MSMSESMTIDPAHLSDDAAEGFYRVVDAAYEKRSLAISSNIHPSGFDGIPPERHRPCHADRCRATRP